MRYPAIARVAIIARQRHDHSVQNWQPCMQSQIGKTTDLQFEFLLNINFHKVQIAGNQNLPSLIKTALTQCLGDIGLTC